MQTSRDWRSVPIPPHMAALPKDERGFPIPVIIVRDHKGKAMFTVNDTRMVDQCIDEKLCGVCGNKLHDDSWVLGGPLSAFHPAGVYIDGPIHHDCGEYALQVCPYLVLSSYRSIPGKADKLNELYGGTTLFVNPTQDPNRPPFFVFAKISGFTRTPMKYIVPVKPFLAVEFWLAGARITEQQAIAKSQKG